MDSLRDLGLNVDAAADVESVRAAVLPVLREISATAGLDALRAGRAHGGLDRAVSGTLSALAKAEVALDQPRTVLVETTDYGVDGPDRSQRLAPIRFRRTDPNSPRIFQDAATPIGSRHGACR